MKFLSPLLWTLSHVISEIVECLKITEDKSSENIVYIPDERLIIATRVMPRRRAWSPCPTSVQYQDARSKPASRYHYSLKSQSLKPATWHHCSLKAQSLKPAFWQSSKPMSSKVQSWHLKRETRSPRSDYREALRYGYNCPHYWVNYCPRNEES